jgi:hypothetical protein
MIRLYTLYVHFLVIIYDFSHLYVMYNLCVLVHYNRLPFVNKNINSLSSAFVESPADPIICNTVLRIYGFCVFLAVNGDYFLKKPLIS